jgi:excisionase family DNA binding protein
MEASPTGTPRQAATPNGPLLATMREAGRELRVSRGTIYKLLREGRLKSVMIGRRRMIPATSLMRLATGR